MMPEANAEHFGHQDKSPAELEQRRRAIIQEMTQFPKGYEDPDMPLPLLQELAVITSRLRRRTAGPPKSPKAARKGTPAAMASPAELKDFLS